MKASSRFESVEFIQKHKHASSAEEPSQSGVFGRHPLTIKDTILEPGITNRIIEIERKNDVTRDNHLPGKFVELTKGPLNVKQWINTAIVELGEKHRGKDSPDTETNKEDNSTKRVGVPISLVQGDVLVDRLITHVQSHTQAIGNSLEELISQTVVRHPRWTFELSHLTNETAELMTMLENLQDTVNLQKMSATPSNTAHCSSSATEEHVQHLLELRGTQKKLKECLSVLLKVASVNINMEEIGETITRLPFHSFSDNFVGLKMNESDKSYKSLTKTIHLIRQVQKDLQDLRKIDSLYGEKQRIAVLHHSQTLEKMLEHECLELLIKHESERAVQLFQLLKLIGRKDTILATYATQIGSMHAERIRHVLAERGKGLKPVSDCSEDLVNFVRDQLVPMISSCLTTEFSFLCEIEEKAAAYELKISSEGNSTQSNRATNVRYDKNNSIYCSLSSEYEDRKATNPIVSIKFATARDKTHDMDAVMQTMEEIIHTIAENSTNLILPLFRNNLTNKDLIDCYEAFKSISVSSTTSSRDSRTFRNGESVPRLHTAQNHHSHLPSLIPDLSERYATQVSLQAVGQFRSVFEDFSLMGTFQDLTDMRLRSCFENSTSGCQTPHAPWRVLRNKSEIQMLSDAFRENLYEIVRFLPQKNMRACVKKWYVSLSQLLLGATSTVVEPALLGQQDSSQQILAHLYFTVKILKPVFLLLQRDAEAFLTSTSTRELYAETSDSFLCILTTELWKPLFTRVDASALELKNSLRRIILEPVFAKTLVYTKLPIWSKTSPQQEKLQQQLHQQSLETGFRPSHIAPSELVRELGQLILEIPLALEALRVSSVNLLSLPDTDTHTQVDLPLSESTHIINEFFPEEAESYLHSIVYAAVDDFVKNKVLQIKIDFTHLEVRASDITAPNPQNTQTNIDEIRKQSAFIALQQLISDLDYMKNLLSAVTDDHFDNLEQVLVRLNGVLSTWPLPNILQGSSFKIYELMNKVLP